MLNRRQFLLLGGAFGLTAGMWGLTTYQQQQLLRRDGFDSGQLESMPVLGLAMTTPGEFDYRPGVSGQIPERLQGTLYRNGPGLYDRDGRRKRCLLDGDGMVQAFRFEGGQVHYRNRFVRTEKFVAESRAGRFLYPTWTTQAPGAFWNNLVGGVYPNQAGITVFQRNGRLYAFDDYKFPYELDPLSLETAGMSDLGLKDVNTVVSAHAKIDPANGDWVFFGMKYGFEPAVHLTTLDARGRFKHHQRAAIGTYTYIHDVIVSRRHVLVVLHPVEIDLGNLLSGRQQLSGALRWRPERGNRVLVFERLGDGRFQTFEAPPAWMWHGMNAFEPDSRTLVADLVGYDYPDHLLGEDPALFAVMEGRRGSFRHPGTLRRYRLNLENGRLEEAILTPGNVEFPFIAPHDLGGDYRYGYLAEVRREDLFYNSVARVDVVSGEMVHFDFGPGNYCSEPVFVADPDSDERDKGWVLVQGHDGHTRRGFLAILDSRRLADGPLARVELTHPVSLSFHGFWASA